MATTDIENAFVAAANIAKKVPKHLQEVAFNRALDQLLTQQPSSAATPETPGRARKDVSQGAPAPATDLLSRIDRTRYPDVGATARIADRALKVLELADADLGIDGLTAAEIADILTKKFKLPVQLKSVAKALERETDTVDVRHSTQRGRTFHLMAPGESYLARLRAGEPDTSAPRQEAPRKGRKQSRGARDREKAGSRGVKAAPKTSRRPGPKAAVAQLIAAGFFRDPRTISAIQSELKHKRGHAYSLQELAPALVRSLRDGTLERERNKSGQYEYTAS